MPSQLHKLNQRSKERCYQGKNIILFRPNDGGDMNIFIVGNTHSYWSNTSLQSSGNKTLMLKIRKTKNGWQIDVIDKLAPNNKANMAKKQPNRKSLWFDSPIQQSNQKLWWSRFEMHCWHVWQWKARGGMYRRHFRQTLFVWDKR